MGRLIERISGSTFVEALFAQVLVLIIFSAAMITLSSVYKMSLKRVNIGLENRLKYLEYAYNNALLEQPYSEDRDDFEIQLRSIDRDGVPFIEIEVLDKRDKKSQIKTMVSGR